MKITIKILLTTLSWLALSHCTSTIDTDANKSILPIVSEEKEVTDITEILNPHVDLDEVIGIVPNTHDSVLTNPTTHGQATKAQIEDKMDYSPLLKYTASGQLSPVFLKGTFDRQDVPSVTKITKLRNQRFYLVFSKVVKYKDTLCRLVEITPPASVRCIDNELYPMVHVNDVHYLPKSEDQLRNFVFMDFQNNIYYATPASEKTYKLMKRNTLDELKVYSETEFSKRLAKSTQDKFYSMCENGFRYCEITSNMTRIYDYDTNVNYQRISDFYPVTQDYIMTRNSSGSPVNDWNWVIYNLGADPNKHEHTAGFVEPTNPEDSYIFQRTIELFSMAGTFFGISEIDEYIDGKKSGYRLSHLFRYPITSLNDSLTKTNISYGTKHRWTASDVLTDKKAIMSAEFTGKTFTGSKYETYLIDLEYVTSAQISELDQMQIQAIRALNAKEVLMIGRHVNDPVEKTKLFKFNLDTYEMTILKEGAMLDGTTLYIL